MTKYERAYDCDIPWKLIRLRLQPRTGDVPTRSELTDLLADTLECGGAVPEDLQQRERNQLAALLRGHLRTTKRRPGTDIGRLMAQTVLAAEISALRPEAKRDSACKANGVSTGSVDRWAHPRRSDKQFDLRMRLKSEYEARPAEFRDMLQHRYPDARA